MFLSNNYDWYSSLQRTCKLTEERMHKPLWKQVLLAYVFYSIFMSRYLRSSLNSGLSFQSVQFTLKESPARITLISRRCNRRLGTVKFRAFSCLYASLIDMSILVLIKQELGCGEEEQIWKVPLLILLRLNKFWSLKVTDHHLYR
ncbi:hypothetical protein B296_00041842 [Ensete ventricosum]|uniref:Uncharacterized protein n=1 Tax=Ensete ventricosum TaxID=4639 RepID=A0A426ZC91_ENSVE|nr:hypothetical protein B296_00041842 [Ensete ventricosum]